jgi:hypothetical protein
MNREFPLTAAILEEEVFPPLKVAIPSLSHEAYSLGQFLEKIVLPHPELSSVCGAIDRALEITQQNIETTRVGYPSMGS